MLKMEEKMKESSISEAAMADIPIIRKTTQNFLVKKYSALMVIYLAKAIIRKAEAPIIRPVRLRFPSITFIIIDSL